MLRFLVSPRALTLHALMALCVAVCVVLALWQWDRAHARVVNPVSAPAVALSELSEPAPALPGRSVGRLVEAEGRYLADDRYFVTGRDQDGQAGDWVMVPLELADGSKVAVVRGFVTDRTDPSASTPPGEVTVTGRLQPSQDLTRIPIDAVSDPARHLLSGVAVSELVGLIGPPFHPGWIAAEAESPEPASTPERVSMAALTIPDGGLKLQNVMYTLQWTVFGAFVLLVYRRFMLDAWDDYPHPADPIGQPDGEDGSTTNAHEEMV